LILCTAFSNGKRHDFRLFKESKVRLLPSTLALVDTAFSGLPKIHQNAQIPRKRSKKYPLTYNDKTFNKLISSKRVSIENILARLKKFKIISTPYRNRRKRFALRFNLIAALYNLEHSIP
jgi:transposase